MKICNVIILLTLSLKLFGNMENLEKRPFMKLKWEYKNKLCKNYGKRKGIKFHYWPQAIDELSYIEKINRYDPWNQLNDNTKEALCHYTKNENELEFTSLPEHFKLKFCNEFKKKHKIEIYNDLTSVFDSIHNSWDELDFEQRKAHCTRVSTVRNPNNPHIKRIEAIYERNKQLILAGAEKRFKEHHERFQKKVAAFKKDFDSRIKRVKNKDESFDKEFDKRLQSFKEKSSKHLNKFKDINKPDKMQQVRDSFIYTFSNGIIGKKEYCTIPSICDENISIKERFINSVNMIFYGDREQSNHIKDQISKDASDQIEKISNL